MAIVIPVCPRQQGYGCVHWHHGVLPFTFQEETGDPDSAASSYKTYLTVTLSMSAGTNYSGFYPEGNYDGPWTFNRYDGSISNTDYVYLWRIFNDGHTPTPRSWQTGDIVSMTATTIEYKLQHYSGSWVDDVVRMTVTLSDEYTPAMVYADLQTIDGLIPKTDTGIYPTTSSTTKFWAFDDDTGTSVALHTTHTDSMSSADIASGYLLYDTGNTLDAPIPTARNWWFGYFAGTPDTYPGFGVSDPDTTSATGEGPFWRTAYMFTGEYTGSYACVDGTNVRRRLCQVDTSLTADADKSFSFSHYVTNNSPYGSESNTLADVLSVDSCSTLTRDLFNGGDLDCPSLSNRSGYYWYTLGTTC